MTLAPAFDPELRILRLPRRHLEGLVTGRRDLFDPVDERARLLVQLGVVDRGRIHPVLQDVLATLRHPCRRFVVRVDRATGVELHRGWVAPTGVVTVSSVKNGDDVHDVRHAPRVTSLARVLAGLLDLGPSATVVGLPDDAMQWASVVHPIREEPRTGWAGDAFGATAPLRLSCLRWSNDGVNRPVTMMALVSAGGHGLVDVLPHGDGFRVVPRTSGEVWVRLCSLSAGLPTRHPT